MMKFICLLALVSVALGSTSQLPAAPLPVLVRQVRAAEVPSQNAQPKSEAVGADDLEGAETFFHKKIYVVPAYGYGGYHGGYYGHGYGYGGYGYGGYGGYGYGGYGYPYYY